MKKLALLFALLCSPALAQNPGVITQGAVTSGHCVKFVNRNLIADNGAACFGGASSFANPTNPGVNATGSNGVALTAMRSDAVLVLDPTPAYVFTGLGATTISAAASGTVPLTISGYSLTGSQAQSMVSWAGTLNTSGSPDVVKWAITDTARGASAKLFNIYAGAAGATSVFSVARTGAVSIGGSFVANNAGVDATTPYVGFNDGAAWGIGKAASGQMGVFVNGGLGFVWTQASMFFKSTGAVRWSSSSTPGADSDVIITSGGTAKVQLGDAAADTTGVSQIFQAQGVTTGGTNNQRGGSLVVSSGQSKGNVTSTLTLQTYATGASGNTLQTALSTVALTNGLMQLPQYTTAGLLQNDASGNVTTNTAVVAATIPANFVALDRLTVVIAGTTWYIPLSAVAF